MCLCDANILQFHVTAKLFLFFFANYRLHLHLFKFRIRSTIEENYVYGHWYRKPEQKGGIRPNNHVISEKLREIILFFGFFFYLCKNSFHESFPEHYGGLLPPFPINPVEQN